MAPEKFQDAGEQYTHFFSVFLKNQLSLLIVCHFCRLVVLLKQSMGPFFETSPFCFLFSKKPPLGSRSEFFRGVSDEAAKRCLRWSRETTKTTVREAQRGDVFTQPHSGKGDAHHNHNPSFYLKVSWELEVGSFKIPKISMVKGDDIQGPVWSKLGFKRWLGLADFARFVGSPDVLRHTSSESFWASWGAPPPSCSWSCQILTFLMGPKASS